MTPSPKRPIRITMVALNARSVVDPSSFGAVGGLETFAWRFAKGLVQSGRCEVQFLIRSPEEAPRLQVDGVQVDSVYVPLQRMRERYYRTIEARPFGLLSRLRIPRLRRWDWGLLWMFPVLLWNRIAKPRFEEKGAMQEKIESYAPNWILTLGVNDTSAKLSQVGKELEVPVAIWFQSNADLDARLYGENAFTGAYNVTSEDAKASLSSPAICICQTEQQFRSLRSLVQTQAIPAVPAERCWILRNPIAIAESAGLPDRLQRGRTERAGVLWIGRADRFHKRPEYAYEIANRCTDVPFTMVLNGGDASLRRELEQNKPSNVTLVTYIPPNEMASVMSRSRVFLSTGSAEFEGFPNVLLEASAAGTPIVSLEDFDHYLQRSEGGVAVGGERKEGSWEQAAAAIRTLVTDEGKWTSYSEQGQRYVITEHRLESIVDAFLERIASIAPIRPLGSAE